MFPVSPTCFVFICLTIPDAINVRIEHYDIGFDQKILRYLNDGKEECVSMSRYIAHDSYCTFL